MGFANVCARVSGISFKISYSSRFQVLQSQKFIEIKNQLAIAKNDGQRVSGKENAENDQKLLTKIEDFCSVLQFHVVAFLLPGVRVFANFGPVLRALVRPPKPPPSCSV